ETLASAFYLNKLSPPDLGREMTAYEFSERMKNYRRENLPLFSPMESEYNGQLCEISFQLLMDAGLLGSPYDIPESVRGANVQFKFKSPLTASEEEQKRNTFMQVREMLGMAAELDQTTLSDVSLSNALRDAIEGIGAPTRWVVPPEVAEQRKQVQAMQQAAAQASGAQ
ncbi:MAG: portal protein, partial [Pseudomonas sp.]|nr:portal protein [Pseudomonas sp.]